MVRSACGLTLLPNINDIILLLLVNKKNIDREERSLDGGLQAPNMGDEWLNKRREIAGD